MKKLLPFLIGLTIFLVPFNNVSAYTGGLMNKKNMTQSQYPLTQGTVNNATTDNSENTASTLSNGTGSANIWYQLPGDYTIDNYQLFGTATASNHVITLYDANKSVIKSVNATNKTGVKQSITSVPNVRYVNLSLVDNSPSSNILEFDIFGFPTSIPVVHTELINLEETHTYNNVNLTWDNPKGNDNFTGGRIYRNGFLIKGFNKTENKFTDSTVSPDTDYEYKVTAIYDDNFETTGIKKTVTTNSEPKPPDEVTELQAKPFYNQVDLSWNLPESKNFKNVIIYRDTLGKTSFLQRTIFGQTVNAAENPIFETNGTIFKDLTVKPEVEYEYTVTTVSKLGLESKGETITIKTPEEPIPVVGGDEYETKPNGDFLINWKEPVKGKVRVLISGKTYKEIEASLGEFLIPGKDMKYTSIGDPDVSIQAISESGKEGVEKETPKTEAPFSVIDLIESGNGLFFYVAPFLLLALSFLLVPKLRNMIINSVRKKKKEKENSDRRTEKEGSNKEPGDVIKAKEKEERQMKKERKDQHKGKEYLEKIEKIETKEIQKQGKAIERKREPRESRIRSEKQIRYLGESRIKRESRERIKEPRRTRDPREPREPRTRRER